MSSRYSEIFATAPGTNRHFDALAELLPPDVRDVDIFCDDSHLGRVRFDEGSIDGRLEVDIDCLSPSSGCELYRPVRFIIAAAGQQGSNTVE